MPLILISGGKLETENLQLASIDTDFLTQQLALYGIKHIKEVTYCDINQHGKMYIQPKFSTYIIHNVNYKGGGRW